MFISQLTAKTRPIIGKIAKNICSKLYEKSIYTTDLKCNCKFEQERKQKNVKKTTFTLQMSFKLTKT